MTQLNAAKWNNLSDQEKLDTLHERIDKLFGIVEDLSHKNHMVVDAISLINTKLDVQAKTLNALCRRMGQTESAE